MGHLTSMFPPTSWTRIRSAASSPKDLEWFCEVYRPPIFRFFRSLRWVRGDDDADERTQEFIAAKVLGDRSICDRADREKGRFRCYLMKAMQRFAIDQERKPKRVQPVSEEALAAMCAEFEEPLKEFLAEWRATIVRQTYDRLEQECQRSGMQKQWRVFESVVVRPKIYGCMPTPYSELVQLTGAATEQQCYTMLQIMKRKFDAMMEVVVAETIDSDDPADVQREIEELKRGE